MYLQLLKSTEYIYTAEQYIPN